MLGSTSLLQQAGLTHGVQHQGSGAQQQLYLDKAEPPPRAAWGRCPQPLPLLYWHSAPQPAPGSAAFSSSMWTPWTSPSAKGGSQPGGNVLWATGMAPVGLPSFPQPLSQNGLSRRQMAVEGLLWHLQLSCWLPFCILLFFGMSQLQMCQADGSWLGQPFWPQGRQGWRRTKLLSIKDEPLTL